MGEIIIIEGLIGCGKTTFCKSIKNMLINRGQKVYFFNESFNFDLLQLYLSDRKKYAFSFQSIMAMERKRVLKDAQQMSKDGYIVIIDRGLLGDYSFAKMLFQNGLINNDEWLTYHSLLFGSNDNEILTNNFFENIDNCRVIYLECSPEIAFERMVKRNRLGEKESYSLKYFQHLDKCYKQTLDEFYPKTKYIDWNQFIDIEEQLIDENIIKNVSISNGIIIN